ncbi:O-methylsterigmatocystin oxidoreductase [Aspergillus pseudoustus]|uniref:O-methylsterigmatocystin oxidoreductase n=1 Tax=Aspergillus pseudoustus TaxID=1810923 RepID=A0ABR4KD91_9EURO
MLASLALCLSLIGVLFVILNRRSRLRISKSPRAPLPPGPPRAPLLGNMNDFPPKGTLEWLFWRDHLTQYGPISSLEIFGKTIIILNSAKDAIEIMDRKSAATRWVVDSTWIKMCGWGPPLATYANQAMWKLLRTNLKREIGSKTSVAHFHTQMELSMRRLLATVVAAPEGLREHLWRDATAFMLNISYGYNMLPHGHDRLYDLARTAVGQFEEIATSMDHPVNYIPLLQYLPTWFPGAEFARMAHEFRTCITQFTSLPRRFVEYKMGQPDFKPSILSRLLEQGPPATKSDEETIMLWSAAAIYIGGADTTVSSMTSFVITMALYPDVQRKAQEELDRVVGYARLPGFEHRERLPYIEATVKENFRWRPPGPVSEPHVAGEVLSCNGYLIPKGSLLLPIIGTFTHDETVYSDPDLFKPERFLSTEDNASKVPEPDPKKYIFGFGRRICPGRFLADDRLWLFVAQFLACFSIAPADPDAPEPKWLPGAISHPEPFPLKIEARSAEHERLVRAVETEAPWVTGDAEDFAKLVGKIEA